MVSKEEVNSPEIEGLMVPPNVDFVISKDPMELLSKKYPDPENFKSMERRDKAKVYTEEILLTSKYYFKPLSGEIAAIEKEGEKSQEELVKNLDELKKVKTMMSQLRLFSSIFLKGQLNEDDEQMKDACFTAEQSLFPWLSGKFPIFTKLNPERKYKEYQVYPLGHDPEYIKKKMNSKDEEIRMMENEDEEIDDLDDEEEKKNQRKGIVLTASDEYVPELLGLLAVLRAEEPDSIPIQIFYTQGTLSDESKRKIIKRATEDENGIASRPIAPWSLNKQPRKLNITFVDVTGAIKSEYLQLFNGWGNKLLAYLYNSFEETIMMDTDTVPLGPLSNFFGSQEYRQSSTVFFRDREMLYKLAPQVVSMFKECQVGTLEQGYLNIRPNQGDPLRSRLFDNSLKDMMESGLVVINRKDHFDAVIASFIMQMTEPIKNVFHGDKEFFWVAEELMGNRYRFNKNPAGSAGVLSKLSVEHPWHRVCSTHPAHFSDDTKTLLWLNSGFLYCKHSESSKDDVGAVGNEGLDLDSIKKLYDSPSEIQVGLIPPPPIQGIEPDKGYPSKFWEQSHRCNGYVRCANDAVGGPKYANDQSIPKGKFIKFSSKDIEKFDYLSKLWVRYSQNRDDM
ncbi:hypothetical protein HII12_002916 [Brettanomyces bruxellensis]|uniref:Alpha-1,3-mannosyltransferase n=1 Tax=Dekkera bruxellensis TaxID=5007 RepID=A0A8H6ETX0_DEKBR|nr:hypothetical protein HII12_002916 [Brettanomyces bruxellensis]